MQPVQPAASSNEPSAVAGLQPTVAASKQSATRRKGDFCIRLHRFLADKTYTDEGGWSPDGSVLIIQDPKAFAAQLEEVGLGSGNFANIRRQLHAYSFKKAPVPRTLKVLPPSLTKDTQCWIHPTLNRQSTLEEVQDIPRKQTLKPSRKSKAPDRTPPAESSCHFHATLAATPASQSFQDASFAWPDPMGSRQSDINDSASSVGGSTSDFEGNEGISVDEGYGRCWLDFAGPLATQPHDTFENQPIWNSNANTVHEPHSPELLASLAGLAEVGAIEADSSAVADWSMPWVSRNAYQDRVVYYSDAYMQNTHHRYAEYESGVYSGYPPMTVSHEGWSTDTSSIDDSVQSAEWSVSSGMMGRSGW